MEKRAGNGEEKSKHTKIIREQQMGNPLCVWVSELNLFQIRRRIQLVFRTMSSSTSRNTKYKATQCNLQKAQKPTKKANEISSLHFGFYLPSMLSFVVRCVASFGTAAMTRRAESQRNAFPARCNRPNIWHTALRTFSVFACIAHEARECMRACCVPESPRMFRTIKNALCFWESQFTIFRWNAHSLLT